MPRGRMVKWKGEKVSEKISESRNLGKYILYGLLTQGGS